jgi:hypothetical protein
MTSVDRFKQLEADYFVLKGKFAAGRITRDEFNAALKEKIIQDASGAYWTIGTDSGKWYRYDGARWLETNPPTTGAYPAAPAPYPDSRSQPIQLGRATGTPAQPQQAAPPPPPMRGSPTGGQPTPLPVMRGPATSARPSQPAVASRVPAGQAVQPLATAPRASVAAQPSPLAAWLATLRALGWRGLWPLAIVLVYVVLTRNFTALIVGLFIALIVRTFAGTFDRLLGPFWPYRDRMPRKLRMLLAWLVPLVVSLLITTTLFNLFAWLPLIGPDASVFVFTALIAAPIAYVLMREPSIAPAQRQAG